MLRLLIVDDSVEAAEAIVSGLRNGGMAVRVRRAPRTRTTLTACSPAARSTWCSPRSDAKHIALRRRSMQAVEASGKDIPVLMLVDTLDDSHLLQAMRAGARGVVAARPHADTCSDAVRAEWADLEARRAPAPPRSAGARDRAPLRRPDRLLARPHRLRPRRHAHPRQPGLPGDVRLRVLRGHRRHVAARPDRAADTSTTSSNCSSSSSRASRRRRATSSRRSAPDGSRFAASHGIHRGHLRGRALPADRAPPPGDRRPGAGARSRGRCASATRSPACSTARPSCAQLEDAVADAAQNGQRTHGLLLIEPDHYANLLQEIGLDAADELLAALAAAPALARWARTTSPRASATTSSPCSARNSDHVQTAALAETVRAPSPATCSRSATARSVATVSIGGVQIGEKIASVPQVLAKASQGLQSADGRGRQPRRDLRSRRRRSRRGRTHRRPGSQRIRDALRGDQFVLNFQPMISLHGDARRECTKRCCACEAPTARLVRR